MKTKDGISQESGSDIERDTDYSLAGDLDEIGSDDMVVSRAVVAAEKKTTLDDVIKITSSLGLQGVGNAGSMWL